MLKKEPHGSTVRHRGLFRRQGGLRGLTRTCRGAGARAAANYSYRGRSALPDGFSLALVLAVLRAVKWSAISLVTASVTVSATMMSPRAWAVAADMFSARVKLPAGVPVSATGVAGAAVAGLGTGAGVISGRALATSTGLYDEALGAPVMMTGGRTVARPRPPAGLTCAAGLDAGAGPAGVLLADGDGLADAGALTLTVPDAAGMVAMAGLVAASAVAVSVTEVTEVAEEATGI